MKGYEGETCAQAIRASMKPGKKISFSKLFKRVGEKGAWTAETICQQTMAHVVNLPPARFRWKSAEPFLLVHENGTFESYDPKRHPQVKE